MFNATHHEQRQQLVLTLLGKQNKVLHSSHGLHNQTQALATTLQNQLPIQIQMLPLMLKILLLLILIMILILLHDNHVSIISSDKLGWSLGLLVLELSYYTTFVIFYWLFLHWNGSQPTQIVISKSDFYFKRLCGDPSEYIAHCFYF